MIDPQWMRPLEKVIPRAIALGVALICGIVASSATLPVGFDNLVDPPDTPLSWDLYLDEQPWPEERVFGGPFGLLAPVLRKGLLNEEARAAAQSTARPTIDPRRDTGLFVARERRSEVEAAPAVSEEGAEETARLLREWGYAQGSK